MAVLFAFIVFLGAGLVKGVLGMGLPTVALGLLALCMPPAEAAALLLIPSLVTNLWQLWDGPALGALLRRFWPMMVSLILGTLITTRWLADAGSGWIPALLGLILMLYGGMGLMSIRWFVAPRQEGSLSILVGFLTGLVTGATGVFVVPAVPYFQALGLGKEALIQTLGLSFTVSTVALGAGLWWHGGLPTGSLGVSGLMVLPALAGLALGQWIRQRLSEAVFKRCFFLGLLLLGFHSLVRAVG
ncbi:hypothetical protein IQ22_00646 [Pseudomonas duriflava]|uniref:Probable membrane transporter protein n=1 Tax=Pseudomonas duriflava TaxID=459528 RepID=A0A562QMK3_9PSED|nr:sulfite exporter TauE/SafE family protein [Pseudomonas duriflava]TWI57430.1 hypothetical protein IQ22_00646 [Pseudomonas duriflava]